MRPCSCRPFQARRGEADGPDRGFLRLFRPLISEDDTAVRQIEKLGFSRNDVRHLIPTQVVAVVGSIFPMAGSDCTCAALVQ